MAPTRSKKQRKSTESAMSVDIQSFPVPPQSAASKTRSPTRTPVNRSPIRKQKLGITMGQKQSLMDNLQEEVTNRARKLRVQYSVLAQQLRSRIEMRINRIPMPLRTATMEELFQKHVEKTAKAAAGPSRVEKINSPAKNLIQEGQSYHSHGSPSPQRPKKRMSDDISVDKENEALDYPKKRLRGVPVTKAGAQSRGKIAPSQVLSPRSANSRTLPHPPIRPSSPTKTFLSRSMSPLKPAVPASHSASVGHGGASGIINNMVEKAKHSRSVASRKATETATALGANRGRRTATQPAASAPRVGRGRGHSDVSHSSDSSTKTVVRKANPAGPAKRAPVKKTVMSTIKGMGSQKKAPVAAKKLTASTASAASATGGRVLRKRN